MPSSEILDDLTSKPISRRAVAAGLWAAPAIALSVAAPAFAASGTHTVQVTATGCASGTSVTFTVKNTGTSAFHSDVAFAVTLNNDAAGTTVTSITVQGGTPTSGSTVVLPALAGGASTTLTVALGGGPSSNSNNLKPTVTGTVSGGGLTGTPSAVASIKKSGSGWACG